MRINFILTLLITLFTLQFANAQQTENYTALDVVHLVTDANFKLNTIYRDRVQGHEDEQAVLRKTIYAANTELMEIRGMLTGGNSISNEKMNSIQKQITSLLESMMAVDESLSDTDLQKAVNNVQSNAASLKKTVKKKKNKTIKANSRFLSMSKDDYSHLALIVASLGDAAINAPHTLMLYEEFNSLLTHY